MAKPARWTTVVLLLVAYWPLAVVPELPYKTALAGGHWNVGPFRMKAFGVLWLVAAFGF